MAAAAEGGDSYKPWQIILTVLGLVVAALSFAWGIAGAPFSARLDRFEQTQQTQLQRQATTDEQCKQIFDSLRRIEAKIYR